MRSLLVASSVVAAAVVLGVTSAAHADESMIRTPGDHPPYHFELEPHGLLGYGGPFQHGKSDFGAGFRGTIVILDNGFVKTINNSVGIGFGGDVFFRNGVVFIPVVMQWNFWLTAHWSAFAEPGFGFAANPEVDRDVFHLTGFVGGRYHFNDRVALTMRFGYPALSVGVSFFL